MVRHLVSWIAGGYVLLCMVLNVGVLADDGTGSTGLNCPHGVAAGEHNCDASQNQCTGDAPTVAAQIPEGDRLVFLPDEEFAIEYWWNEGCCSGTEVAEVSQSNAHSGSMNAPQSVGQYPSGTLTVPNQGGFPSCSDAPKLGDSITVVDDDLGVELVAPTSVEPDGAFPTNVELSFHYTNLQFYPTDVEWTFPGGTPSTACCGQKNDGSHTSPVTTTFTSSGVKKVEAYHAETTTAPEAKGYINVKIIDPSVTMTHCAPSSQSSGTKISATNDETEIHTYTTGSGFWWYFSEPIKVKWVATVGSTVDDTGWVSAWSQDDWHQGINPIDVPPSQGSKTLSVVVTAKDEYSHQGQDSHSYTIYPQYRVEKTGQKRNGAWYGHVRLGGVTGTQANQQVSIQTSYDFQVQRSWQLTGQVQIGVEPVKAVFGTTVGTQVSSGTSYGGGTSIVIDGTQNSAAFWFRYWKEEEEGDVIETDSSGSTSVVGGMWVDQFSWDAGIVEVSHADYNAGNIPQPGGW